jgi:hypothetical protein
MQRRIAVFIGLAALVVGASSLGAQQQNVHATVLLQGGQRYDGHDLMYRLDRPNMTIKSDQGATETFPVDRVAFVEFVPGTADLPASSLGTLGPQSQTLQKRDGGAEHGRLIELGHEKPGDETSRYLVIFKPDNGNEERLDVNQVSRVYFAPPTTTVSSGGTAAVATSGAQQNVTVRLPGNQQWVPTGVTVQRGQTIQVTATGTIKAQNGTIEVGPVGSSVHQANAPLPNVAVGGLIGRIGPTGQPFGIGDHATIQAPANGPLFVGINDSQLQNNVGDFMVTVHVQ